MKTNIYILYGGRSAEHEISLQSAMAVINGLDKQKYVIHPVYIGKDGTWQAGAPVDEGTVIDDKEQLKTLAHQSLFHSLGNFLLECFKKNEKSIIFPVLHGPNGEDGTIQGLLELLDIPYVGNGVLASALGMDKAVMKDLLTKEYIPQSHYMVLKYQDWQENKEHSYTEVEEVIGYPCFVKPARLGSSIGISRCESRETLGKAIQEAFLYDHKLVIEQEIIGREMQIAVLGNHQPQSSVVGEFILERPFMDYDAKYVDGKLLPIIPAKLSPEVSRAMRDMSLKVFKLLNCQGIARIDYFVTKEEQFYVNEVNTMPGFTKQSMTPALWNQTDGTTYSQLLDKLIQLGFEAYEEKKSIVIGR
ncbi:D-alanine-D-alanine ligase [Anaerosolibacter carboniphilus]|uniref:D-alanine--D-alanine ligase n=1 Tax=Anaerosolibacter carboniphilus TaxID=1417629 RepID=A0A841L8Y9_9FIRM|nr:D-alanine--D-alanine ligase [Anaerosolibacter carboniphilus]MBB6218725.1 D-alanine-D-alanine ligase [Anaerosolibacter carboniphilus]